MKVYQINSVCGTGSTGRIACDIKDVLIKEGNECRIAYGRGYYDNSDCFKFTSDISFKLHALKSRFTDKQGYYSNKATKKLISDLKSYNPDIIHLHNIHGYYLNFKLLFDYLKSCGKPIVWTLHDCWAFTGHCAYFDFAGCDKWKTECFKCPQKKSYPASILNDNSNNNFFAKKQAFSGVPNLNIVTPSHWLADTVGQSFLKDYNREVIYNGIDLSVFKPTEGDFRKKHNLGGKKIVLGVANIWEERKGFKDFLSLAEKLPNDYVIVLVGLTMSFIKTLPHNVIGVTRTENIIQLAELYTTADVYVNTSYEETMGLTTVEALATGTPAVVYDRTAVPEVIDSTCGSVVMAGNTDELLRAVLSADFDSNDCIKRAQLFEKMEQYSKYIELYKTVLSK